MKFILIHTLIFLNTTFFNLNTNEEQVPISPAPQRMESDNSFVRSQDTVKVSNEFIARLELLSKDQGGRKIPFYSSFSLEVVIKETSVRGRITFPKEVQVFRAGDKRLVSVKLTSSTELVKGQVFEVKELGRKIGVGTILEVLK